jgi:hypothetical protein
VPNDFPIPESCNAGTRPEDADAGIAGHLVEAGKRLQSFLDELDTGRDARFGSSSTSGKPLSPGEADEAWRARVRLPRFMPASD